MTLTVPSALFDKYYEAANWMLTDDHIGRVCTLIYPPKRTSCTNCVRPAGSTVNSVYRHGGPAPFNFGACPLCGGNGYSEVETTATIRMRVYWNRRDWSTVISSIIFPDAEAMGIGYMTDLPNLLKAVEIKLVSQQAQTTKRYSLAGQPQPHGFGRNTYFIAFFKASGG